MQQIVFKGSNSISMSFLPLRLKGGGYQGYVGLSVNSRPDGRESFAATGPDRGETSAAAGSKQRESSNQSEASTYPLAARPIKNDLIQDQSRASTYLADY